MHMFIPHSHPQATSEDLDAVRNALLAGHFSQGAEVTALENELCERFGHEHAVVVSSGTSALLLSLIALGVKADSPVFLPAYTCQSLYSAVMYARAIPLCMDCRKNDVCMMPAPDTHEQPFAAAIVPHMFGYEACVQTWKENGIAVIEDCAQAAGGTGNNGIRIGSLGNIAILSFYATKLLPAGEGGACLTNDKRTADMIRALRNSDEQQLNPHAFNFKMTDICAAIARVKLRHLDENIAIRNRIAGQFDEAFGLLSFRMRHTLNQPVCFRYLLEVDPDKIRLIMEKAKAAGIDCRRPVWNPLHHSLGFHCPETDRRHQRLISIPIYPSLSEEAVERICHELSKIIADT